MLLIREIADKLEIPDEFLEYYGRYTAKIRLELLTRPQRKGRLILVTAITPTSHGEGKTVVSIGLTQALSRLGKRAAVTLREPSLGPVFGIKGGATGGGLSQVLPSDIINLHFNGDIHAVTAAHNLLAAMIDAHLHHGNSLRIDVDNITWPRAMDMNDRALVRAITEATEHLGLALANLVNLYNPEKIIVGGWFGDLIARDHPEELSAAVRRFSLKQPGEQAVVERSQLGMDAVTLGAATLPVDRFIETGLIPTTA